MFYIGTVAVMVGALLFAFYAIVIDGKRQRQRTQTKRYLAQLRWKRRTPYCSCAGCWTYKMPNGFVPNDVLWIISDSREAS